MLDRSRLVLETASIMFSIITDPFFYLAAIPAVILMGLAKGGFAGLGLIAIPLMALVVSRLKPQL